MNEKNENLGQSDTLHNLNLKLKKRQNKVPFFNSTGQEKDLNKTPFFNAEGQEKKFRPKELIKTSFYKYIPAQEPEHFFNALLYGIPSKGDVFNIGGPNGQIYIVKNVTRNLAEIRPGAMREISINVLVKGNF